MATKGGGAALQTHNPIFKGDNFNFWSIKLRTIFIAFDLWDSVENGYDDIDLERATQSQKNEYKERVKRDAKALSVIQEGVDETIFPKISLCRTAKEAWDVLKEQFEGTDKTIMVKLQTLRRQFETFSMGYTDSVQGFLDDVIKTVNAMRAYGEVISDQKIVEKVLRSLPHKYDHVVAAIEESKDLTKYTFNELIGSLQAHEQRLNRSEEVEERALWAKTDGNMSCSICKRTNHSSGNCYFKDKNKKAMQCYHCKKFGHIEKYCRNKPTEEQAQFCLGTEDDEILL